MKIPKQIETERLILKQLSLDYVSDRFAGLTENVTRYMAPKPMSLEETIDWVNENIEMNSAGEQFLVDIIDKETGEFIGGGGIHHIDTKTPEFGIWTKESSHGNYYGREAVERLNIWAKENLEYDYILYPADVANLPSRKIAEYLGGKLEREYTDKNVRGENIHLVEYRIGK